MRKSFENRGLEVPEMFRQIEIAVYDRFYWDAFSTLSSERPIGQSVGLIPYRAIRAYARDYRVLDLDDYQDFETIIMAMDQAYVEVVVDRQRREQDMAAQKAKRR